MASRNYPANTQIQKFLEESYNKERDTRLAWFHKRSTSATTGQKSKQYEVFRRKIENAPKPRDGLLERMNTDVQESRFNKKISQSNDITAKRPLDPSLLTAEMRPVTPNTKLKLFDGFTKEGKGRYQYLHSRYMKSPEDKFSFPLLSSWEYGWRLGDVVRKENIKKPPHGRTRIVADTFYTRTGVPNNPMHETC
ncbi:hypothetical protein ACJMK2_016148 [Sinanodonta woodiana]|uniref:Sperm microtubule inner protein 1 C-terminal domain-containing protein n=1 Tax=Sinanodonta woodiana TaxID=1069815 RepID=A0ABD3UW63_SINWO